MAKAKRKKVSKEFSDKFESEEVWKDFLLYLEEQLKIFRKARERCLHEKGELWTVLNPLNLALADTADTICHLSQNHRARDCFVLARVVVETAINICFICAEGPPAAKSALSHARQKAYRDLERSSKIRESSIHTFWTNKKQLEVSPELQADIDAFTHKNGKENTSWTPETVHKKLEFLIDKYGEKKASSLQWAFFTIYRHASEIAHGTYFGAIFLLGLTGPTPRFQTQEDYIKHLRGNLNMLALMISGALTSTIEILATEVILPPKSSP